jgi:hypothetical protein
MAAVPPADWRSSTSVMPAGDVQVAPDWNSNAPTSMVFAVKVVT